MEALAFLPLCRVGVLPAQQWRNGYGKPVVIAFQHGDQTTAFGPLCCHLGCVHVQLVLAAERCRCTCLHFAALLAADGTCEGGG